MTTMKLTLPSDVIQSIDKWYDDLSKLPDDLERSAAFFERTGEDVDGIEFWHPVTHRPMHSAGCMCGTDRSSVFSCGFWKLQVYFGHR